MIILRCKVMTKEAQLQQLGPENRMMTLLCLLFRQFETEPKP